jgi:hypothetical protein
MTAGEFFQFDHTGIKKVIILLELPEVIITPVHNDHILADEAVCLLFGP